MAALSLSVIIPCYNGMPYVLEAVESVLDQVDDGVECAVVDDGSTDGSAEQIVRRFGGRARLIRQANAGVSAARNRGLAETSGELVIWLDADDRLLPDTLALRRRPFEEDPTLEMLVAPHDWIDMETGESLRSPRACPADYVVSCLLPRKELSHLNATTFRRSDLERIGAFDPSLKTFEDYDLYLRAWVGLRWRFVDTVMSWQRLGTYPSLSRRTPKLDWHRNHGLVLEKNRSCIRKHPGGGWAWRQAYMRWATRYSLVHLLHGNRSEAARWASWGIARVFGLADRDTYKHLVEGLLPAAVYRSAASWTKRLA